MTESDGRMFGWQRVISATHTASPVIVWDKLHSGSKVEFVGNLRLLKPEQYGLTLAELAEIYPAPEVQPETGE